VLAIETLPTIGCKHGSGTDTEPTGPILSHADTAGSILRANMLETCINVFASSWGWPTVRCSVRMAKGNQTGRMEGSNHKKVCTRSDCCAAQSAGHLAKDSDHLLVATRKGRPAQGIPLMQAAEPSRMCNASCHHTYHAWVVMMVTKGDTGHETRGKAQCLHRTRSLEGQKGQPAQGIPLMQAAELLPASGHATTHPSARAGSSRHAQLLSPAAPPAPIDHIARRLNVESVEDAGTKPMCDRYTDMILDQICTLSRVCCGTSATCNFSTAFDAGATSAGLTRHAMTAFGRQKV
jgi:hypothetical protein